MNIDEAKSVLKYDIKHFEQDLIIYEIDIEAIETLLSELDSKDKEIEYITKQNYEITNSGIIKDINKLSGKSRLAECCHYALKAGIKMENSLREKDKVIDLMSEWIYVEELNDNLGAYSSTSAVKEHFENLAKEEK
jgi:hypothetical protein